ncbi:hypothetical protein J4226_00500 [Candidatus Pacearchaeota archaeon]|nr:hypothetical protein [Candidatus Pacearchaeota archaeon]
MEVSVRRLIVGLVLIFFLGVLFAVVNGYYVSEEGSSLPLIVYGISFLSIVVGGGIVVLFQSKINKVLLNRVLSILPEGERKIVGLLVENNGSLEQNRLVALSGLNKVKVSRILSELETRRVLARVNLGNTKLVSLKI